MINRPDNRPLTVDDIKHQAILEPLIAKKKPKKRKKKKHEPKNRNIQGRYIHESVDNKAKRNSN